MQSGREGPPGQAGSGPKAWVVSAKPLSDLFWLCWWRLSATAVLTLLALSALVYESSIKLPAVLVLRDFASVTSWGWIEACISFFPRLYPSQLSCRDWGCRDSGRRIFFFFFLVLPT